MKRNAVLPFVISLVLVAAIAVGTTLAYFSAQTDTVTNTFTTAGIDAAAITLDEVRYDPENPLVAPGSGGDSRVAANTYENLLPGTVVTKDPIVHIAAGTMAGYVVLKLENASFLRENAGLILGVSSEKVAGGNIARSSDLSWVPINANGSIDTNIPRETGADGVSRPVVRGGYYLYKGAACTVDGNGRPTGIIDASGSDAAIHLEALFNYAQFDSAMTQAPDMTLLQTHPVIVRAAFVQAANVDEQTAIRTAVELFEANPTTLDGVIVE